MTFLSHCRASSAGQPKSTGKSHQPCDEKEERNGSSREPHVWKKPGSYGKGMEQGDSAMLGDKFCLNVAV